jgi:hypothetical protein
LKAVNKHKEISNHRHVDYPSRNDVFPLCLALVDNPSQKYFPSRDTSQILSSDPPARSLISSLVDVPDEHGAVCADRHELPVVGRERERRYDVGVPDAVGDAGALSRI